ncbi:amidohydrolase family protein [Phytoactinopolyspora halotolerans]|uniref:Amidohydrolase family protein n=1 Tax=Phytoactinopolyspora halotolerans TaxID=1981512 RepID=A0A6L9S0C3_9ACTN|nr:amidohydrolase family protein [Phytoactinopolyspora halotolerans]NED98572.1 amidohydrolase family protein [Phytoactinopolyspora halotolerans]
MAGQVKVVRDDDVTTPLTGGAPPVIDAHQHFWRLQLQEQTWRTADHGAIAADYEPSDLAGPMSEAGVDATILIQSVDSAEENDRLAAYAATTSFIAGVVGWAPLRDPRAAAAEIDRMVRIVPRLRGVRCLVGRERLDWLTEPPALQALRMLADLGLSWDVVPVTAAQSAVVVAAARQVPQLRVVVDHLGRPPVEAGGWEPWASSVRALASCPNVAMKVSVGIDVLTAWGGWNPHALAPYVQCAVEQFGPSRLMLASNWPVVLLRQNYADAWNGLIETLARIGLSRSEIADIRGGTARRWYRTVLGSAPSYGTHRREESAT